MNLLPNHHLAVFDIRKLTEYALNEEHLVGLHKAAAFRKALGIGVTDAKWLREQILLGISEYPVVEVDENSFGKRYYVDCKIEKNGKGALIRSTWIIRSGIQIPFLTSCYPI